MNEHDLSRIRRETRREIAAAEAAGRSGFNGPPWKQNPLRDGQACSAFALAMPPLTLSERGKRMILHALGLSQVRRWSYRNHVAGCDETCEPLVECGYMVRGRLINQETSPLQLYHVTDDGARAAGVLNRFRREDRLRK
jgi:hypothetical protein